MSFTSRQELMTKVSDYTIDHKCPYAEQLLNVGRQKQQLGSYGIKLVTLSGLVTELGKLHATNTCPPTHVGAGPTAVWAGWVKDIRE